MGASWGGAGDRFRTAPPTSVSVNGVCVVDSYTGFLWCGRGLHLLTPERQSAHGGCKACETRAQRVRRARKRLR